MELTGEAFTNSPTCEGVAFTDNEASHDIAKIEVKGRYPESGWAFNEVAHEMVIVTRGIGSVAIKDEGVTALAEGSGVSIAPEKRFAWEGDMTLIMSCSPKFDPSQYKVEGDV